MSQPSYDPEIVRQALALDQQKLDQDKRRAAVDVRRFALTEAVDFFRGTTAQVVDTPAVLLCAERFHRWLDRGEMPDLSESVKHLHGFAWNLVRGLYPEAEIQRAMQQGGAE